MSAASPIQPQERDQVLKTLIDLEQGYVSAGQQFDWNPDFVHGYAARDIGHVVGRPWTRMFVILEALADDGTIHRTQPGPRGTVTCYRTVGA